MLACSARGVALDVLSSLLIVPGRTTTKRVHFRFRYSTFEAAHNASLAATRDDKIP
jgi:hypothetical protein